MRITHLMILSALWIALLGESFVCQADTSRTQTIALRKGWNSVFLQVQPHNSDPKDVFAGTPVQTVTTFFAQTRPAAYIRNPGDAPWREEGWAVWYAPGRSDAFLANLHAIHANQGYLIQASADYVWQVTGDVQLHSVRWQPDSYNFTGFALDPSAPPTFEKFFSGSTAHQGQRVFQLVDGQWMPVRDLARTAMRAGEAYWVYCKGGSDYQGPMRVRVSGEALHLGPVARGVRLELINSSSIAAHVTVESGDAVDALPLAYVSQDLPTLSTTFPSMPRRLVLPDIGPGKSHFFRLAARREAMTAPSQSTLLRVSNGEGVEFWLPVTAERGL
jgi:hypothetical protein